MLLRPESLTGCVSLYSVRLFNNGAKTLERIALGIQRLHNSRLKAFAFPTATSKEEITLSPLLVKEPLHPGMSTQFMLGLAYEIAPEQMTIVLFARNIEAQGIVLQRPTNIQRRVSFYLSYSEELKYPILDMTSYEEEVVL